MIDKRVRGFTSLVVQRLEAFDKAYRTSPNRVKAEEEAKRSIAGYFSEHYKDAVYAEGRSSRHPCLPRMATRSLVSDDTTHFMPHDQFFKLDGETLEDDQVKEPVVIELLHLLREGKFERFFRGVSLQAHLCGTCPVEVGWVEKYRTTTTPGAEGGDEEFKRDRELIYNGPKFRIYDFFSVFFDPCPPPDLEDHEVARHVHSYMTIEQLKRQARDEKTGVLKYEDIEKIKPKDDEDGGHDENKQYHEEIGIQGTRVVGGQRVKTRHGDFEITIDGEPYLFENYVITWVNGETLIRFEPNTRPGGRIPVQAITCTPSGIPGRVEGQSSLGPADGLSSAFTAILNQDIDLRGKMIKGTGTVLENSPAFVDGVTLDGGLVPVSSHDDVRPYPSDVRLLEIVNILGLYKGLYFKATGAPQMHSVDEQPRTAFEHSRLAATQSALTTERIKHYSEQFTPLFYDLLELRAEFGDEMVSRPPLETGTAKPKKLFGLIPMGQGQPEEPEWVDIPREVFKRKFRITLLGAGIVALKAELLAGYSRFFELYANLPPQTQARINIEHIIKSYWKAAVGRDDGDLFKTLTAEDELLSVAENAQAQGAPNAQ